MSPETEPHGHWREKSLAVPTPLEDKSSAVTRSRRAAAHPLGEREGQTPVTPTMPGLLCWRIPAWAPTNC